MTTIEEHINFIHTKLQVLLKKYANLQKEQEHLSREIEIFRENEKEYLKKIDSLEMQAGILKAAAGRLDEKDKKNLDKKIDQYIRDLEKCMAMLNN